MPRRHDIDAIRAIAFGLLILYHIGMFYVSWDWHVKSTYELTWLEIPMSFVNQWRMPLIFAVSGLALHFMLAAARRPSIGAVLKSRAVRLGVPLAFGMLVIVPPQAYLEARANGVVEPGYLAFLWRYYSFGGWPDDAFAGAEFGLTWNHLWYLPYLLSYTVILLPVLTWRPVARGLTAFRRLPLPLIVAIPVLLLLPAGLWLFPRFPYISHDLIGDPYGHALYATLFAAGFAIGVDGTLWTRLAASRYRLVLLALGAYALLRLVAVDLGDDWLGRTLQSLVVYTNRWSWILVIFAFGHHWLNRPMPWLGYANRAVYPWYVVHQTVTVVAGYSLTRLALGPVVEPLLLILVTVAGCAAAQWIVERVVPAAAPLLGLPAKKLPRVRAASPSPPVSDIEP